MWYNNSVIIFYSLFERIFVMGIFSSLFKSYSEKQIKRIVPIVDEIEALAGKFAAMSDSEMRKYTDKLKGDLANGKIGRASCRERVSPRV